MLSREELIGGIGSPRSRAANRNGSIPAPPGRGGAVLTGGPIAESRGPLACLRRDAIFRRALAAADCIAVMLALLTVVEVLPSLGLRGGVLVVLPLTVLAAKLQGLYDRDETLLRKTTLEEMPKLFHLATLCSLLLWLGHDLIIAGAFNRVGALLLWVTLTVTMPITRVAARVLSLRLAPAERCLVVGDPPTLQALANRLGKGCGVNAEIVGHVDLEDESLAGEDAFGGEHLEWITRRVSELDVHRVIVAPRSADGGELLELVRVLKRSGTRVSLVPRVLEVLGTSVEFDDVHGITVMGVRRFHLSRSSALLKRAFDLVGASLLLLVFAPLMASIAVAIKLESRGHVLFRQVRVGRRGSQFDMLKFRTMVSNAEALKPGLLDLNEA